MDGFSHLMHSEINLLTWSMIGKTYITIFPICRHTHTQLYPHCVYKMIIIKQKYVNRKEYM